MCVRPCAWVWFTLNSVVWHCHYRGFVCQTRLGGSLPSATTRQLLSKHLITLVERGEKQKSEITDMRKCAMWIILWERPDLYFFERYNQYVISGFISETTDFLTDLIFITLSVKICKKKFLWSIQFLTKFLIKSRHAQHFSQWIFHFKWKYVTLQK